MSDDNNLSFEINWDQDVDRIEEMGPRVIVEYGAMQYLGSKKVIMFAKDSKVTWPNLIINGQPYSRGGMKEGHEKGGRNAIVHPFAFFGKAYTDDRDFTTVKMFNTLPIIPVEPADLEKYPVIQLDEGQIKTRDAGKTVWLSDWSNLMFPVLKSLPTDVRARVTRGEKVYFSAETWNTGAKPNESKIVQNEDGSPKKYYDHYWYNITVYASEAEMLAARAAAKNGSGVSLGVDDLPAEWVNAGGTREGLYADIKERYEKGQPFKTIVKKCDLEGETTKGQPIDAKALVAAALDQPVEMLKTWFSA